MADHASSNPDTRSDSKEVGHTKEFNRMRVVDISRSRVILDSMSASFVGRPGVISINDGWSPRTFDRGYESVNCSDTDCIAVAKVPRSTARAANMSIKVAQTQAWACMLLSDNSNASS